MAVVKYGPWRPAPARAHMRRDVTGLRIKHACEIIVTVVRMPYLVVVGKHGHGPAGWAQVEADQRAVRHRGAGQPLHERRDLRHRPAGPRRVLSPRVGQKCKPSVWSSGVTSRCWDAGLGRDTRRTERASRACTCGTPSKQTQGRVGFLVRYVSRGAGARPSLRTLTIWVVSPVGSLTSSQ
jgi:hypothetical protein